MTGVPDITVDKSYYLLMIYGALFGAISSLLAAAYIALYNQGVKFFEQPVIVVLGINIGRWYSNCRRSVSWFSNQVFWPACGIRSCTGAICQDWPPQHQSRPEYPPSSIYRIVEWCCRRTRGPTCLSEWRSWKLYC